MTPLVECVPNFSEGRNPEVVEQIAAALRQHPVQVLDVERDPDHHRAVITVAGEPAPLASAMLDAVAVAVERISLERHRGVHPRLGAVDVVPFVPLRESTLEDCADLARSFGSQAAARFDLPVYLYEAAALRSDRRSLPAVRGKGYEWLKTAIERDPTLAPDFGPSRIGPAGAMIVGARHPLIAFNLFLNTSDVALAQTIAHAVRERDGGLPGVRALGLLVGGRAQVSCNLIDFRRTNLMTLVDTVRQEARKLGAAVTDTELIGLAPQAALLAAAAQALGLPPAAASATIEGRCGALTGDFRPIIFE